MHAHHTTQFGVVRTLTIGKPCGVVGAVQGRTDVVAHAAVNGYVHTFMHRIAGLVGGVAIQPHWFDGAHTVERHAGRRDRPTTRFEGDDRSGHAERTVHGGDRVGKTAEFHVDVHGILAIGVGHGIATAQIDLRQRVRIGGVEGLA